MDELLKQYEDLKAQADEVLNEISKMALRDVNDIATDIKMSVTEQKTAPVQKFINDLMDKKIVIDETDVRHYIYRDDYLKINTTLLYKLYVSDGGHLSKFEFKYRLKLLGYPKSGKNLCWTVSGLKTYTTHGYKLYRPKQHYPDNEKMVGKHTAVADIKVYSLKQKTASVKKFIIKLMDRKIAIDKMYEKQYIYRDDYLKINFNLLYTLYTPTGILMSKKEMRNHLNVLGYPKGSKTLGWWVGGKTYATSGYKLCKHDGFKL